MHFLRELFSSGAIVRALGGKVTLESAPGRGSVFVVTLPAIPVAAS